MTPTRFGIAGLGNIGSSHVPRFLDGHVPGAEVTAVADTNPTKLERFSQVKGWTDSAALIRSGEIDALLITDRAVGSDQGQKFVYVVNGDKPERRSVTLGPVIDGLRVVRQGLKADDQVVIDGLMKIRPDSPVKADQGDMNKFASDQLELKPMVGAPPKGGAGK